MSLCANSNVSIVASFIMDCVFLLVYMPGHLWMANTVNFKIVLYFYKYSSDFSPPGVPLISLEIF